MTEPGNYGEGNEGQQGTGAGTNPAWNEFLEPIPQEFHEKVTPVLQKWDQGVQERFQKVQSEYEPWKPIIQSGVDPETTDFALKLLNNLNDNPEMVYNAIKEYYKFDGTDSTGSGTSSEQGQSGTSGKEDPPDPYASKFAEYERQQQIIAQTLLNQKQAEADAKAEAELDRELNSLKKDYGEYDERYVLAMMQNGYEAKDAVEAYFQWREQEIKRNVPKPLIMGGGGGLPNQNTDVKKLDDKGTKNLVVQMLAAAAEQNRQ